MWESEMVSLTNAIYKYESFAEFLRDAVEFKRKARPGFSLSVLCRHAEIRSPSAIAMIISQSRKPSISITIRACVALGLSDKEIVFAEALVNREIAQTKTEKRQLNARINAMRE